MKVIKYFLYHYWYMYRRDIGKFVGIRLKVFMWFSLIIGMFYFLVHGYQTSNTNELVYGMLLLITIVSIYTFVCG